MSRDEKAHKMVEDGAALLDVRSPAEFAGGHVSGAVNIPVDQLPGGASKLDPQRAVVVYCRSGMRSAKAAKLLRQSGFQTVHDMGSISKWEGGNDLAKYAIAGIVLMGLGFGLSTVFSGGMPPTGSAMDEAARGHRAEIDVTELKKRLDAGDVVLIDVRTTAEYTSGHVAGARHIPLAELNPADFGKETVHVMCRSGGRSSTGTDVLVGAGIDAVNVEGGILAWQAAGFPVE